MSRLLLIESSDERRSSLCAILERGGFTVDAIAQPLPGIDPAPFAAIVASARALTDSALFERLACSPTVLIAEGGSIAEAVRAIRRGAADYLPLPVTPEQLLEAVERAILAPRRAGAGPGRKSVTLIGRCRAMQTLNESIRKVAPTEATVVIEGETGTGKELVARAVHDASPRSHAPFITLNCATVPSDLIESELFGSDDPGQPLRKGLVAAANGGTLFLDEVAELPAEAQSKLLRLVLQRHPSAHLPLDVRLIVASHRDLAKLTGSGSFRSDLYYRLNVFRICVPPLRERGDDIAELAEHLLGRATDKLGKRPLRLSHQARSALRRYRWPGNVRELENAIERAAILCEGEEIDAGLLAVQPDPPGERFDALIDESENTTLEDYFVHFVREHEDHLTETEIAEKLGISRKSLWERRQRLNIPRRKTRQRGPRRPDE
jgi:DNA-binding NtrC family response regulator